MYADEETWLLLFLELPPLGSKRARLVVSYSEAHLVLCEDYDAHLPPFTPLGADLVFYLLSRIPLFCVQNQEAADHVLCTGLDVVPERTRKIVLPRFDRLEHGLSKIGCCGRKTVCATSADLPTI